MIVAIIFHITPTKTMPLYPPLYLQTGSMVIHISYYDTLPSRNFSCAILTKYSYLVLSGFFSCVASLIHIFICSTRIPEREAQYTSMETTHLCRHILVAGRSIKNHLRLYQKWYDLPLWGLLPINFFPLCCDVVQAFSRGRWWPCFGMEVPLLQRLLCFPCIVY